MSPPGPAWGGHFLSRFGQLWGGGRSRGGKGTGVP